MYIYTITVYLFQSLRCGSGKRCVSTTGLLVYLVKERHLLTYLGSTFEDVCQQ